MMNKQLTKTKKIALSGVISALALVIMALSSFLSVASYSLAALAGVVLILLVIEAGNRYAVAAYFIVSVLSILLLPDKETAVLFILFMGFYPILKALFEKISNIFIEYAAKFALFNLAVVLFYWVVTKLLNIEFMDTGIFKMSLPILLIFANLVFGLYDYALTKIISLYLNNLRPRFYKRFL